MQCLGLPSWDDELTVAVGSLPERRLLAMYTREGSVTGAVAMGHPAALMRCRPAVAAAMPLAELLHAAPWDGTGRAIAR